MTIQRFEDLVIWKEAQELCTAIYIAFKENRDRGFKDQIQRAAVSIMNNIAEGTESGSDAKFINFLNIAKGSCSEVKSMLYLCEDLSFCTHDERLVLQSKLKQISTGIVRMIKSLSNKNS